MSQDTRLKKEDMSWKRGQMATLPECCSAPAAPAKCFPPAGGATAEPVLGAAAAAAVVELEEDLEAGAAAMPVTCPRPGA